MSSRLDNLIRLCKRCPSCPWIMKLSSWFIGGHERSDAITWCQCRSLKLFGCLKQKRDSTCIMTPVMPVLSWYTSQNGSGSAFPALVDCPAEIDVHPHFAAQLRVQVKAWSGAFISFKSCNNEIQTVPFVQIGVQAQEGQNIAPSVDDATSTKHCWY